MELMSLSRVVRSPVTEGGESFAMKRAYDFVVVGSGPAAAAWVRTALKRQPSASILMLERGSYCKTDILTEKNPFKVLRDSRHMIREQNHEVMQGNCVGGGSQVNGYVWITPSHQDLANGFGEPAAAELAQFLPEYEEFSAQVASNPPIHMLHKMLTARLPRDIDIETSTPLRCRQSNRNTVFVGTPTLDMQGQRHSALHSVLEPLWREHYQQLDIDADTEVDHVIFDGDGTTAIGVRTQKGDIISAGKVILAAGCIESPAILQRSGVGDGQHLKEHQIAVRVDNPLVGRNLKDKMLTDDMLVLTRSTLRDFDESLFVMNRVFDDGTSVQLHRFDTSTVANKYLVISRLLRGNGPRHLDRILSQLPGLVSASTVLCFQTNFKMKSSGTVTLKEGSKQANLDLTELFAEAVRDEHRFKSKLASQYDEILTNMIAPELGAKPCIPSILTRPGGLMRMVWHFAGSCAAGDVVDPSDFGVLNTTNLHVVDVSTAKVSADGGAMAFAYMTGHLAAAQMLK